MSAAGAAGDIAATWEPIDTLKPWDRNPRDHTPEKIAEVAVSIQRFGFGAPIIARTSDRVVIAGHRRMLAAQSLAWTAVPVRFMELTEEEAWALALADNRLGEEVGWNEDMLAGILKDLGKAAQGIGWNLEQIETMLIRARNRDLLRRTLKAGKRLKEGDAPTTALGESFVLAGGRVLLVCGSSEDSEVWATIDRWLGDRAIDHVLTDPPYGVDYQGGVTPHTKRVIDAIAGDVDLPDLPKVYGEALARQRKGGSWHVFGPSSPTVVNVFGPLRDMDVWRHTWVWDKGVATLGRCDRHYAHELIAYGWKPGAAHRWLGGRRKNTFLRYARPQDNDLHPTQKPLEMCVEILKDVCVTGEIVLDPFAGSGSSGVAALEVDCHAVLIELNPSFCDAIRLRLGDESVLADEKGPPEGDPEGAGEAGD